MPKSYKATYEDGRLEWVGEQPEKGRHNVIVTVLDNGAGPDTFPSRPNLDEIQGFLDDLQRLQRRVKSPEEIQQMLDDAWGAWDSGQSPEEIDAELEAMRAEWDRPWDDPDWKPE